MLNFRVDKALTQCTVSVGPFSDPSGLFEAVWYYFMYRYGSSPFLRERHSLPALMGMGQGKAAAIEEREHAMECCR